MKKFSFVKAQIYINVLKEIILNDSKSLQHPSSPSQHQFIIGVSTSKASENKNIVFCTLSRPPFQGKKHSIYWIITFFPNRDKHSRHPLKKWMCSKHIQTFSLKKQEGEQCTHFLWHTEGHSLAEWVLPF